MDSELSAEPRKGPEYPPLCCLVCRTRLAAVWSRVEAVQLAIVLGRGEDSLSAAVSARVEKSSATVTIPAGVEVLLVLGTQVPPTSPSRAPDLVESLVAL